MLCYVASHQPGSQPTRRLSLHRQGRSARDGTKSTGRADGRGCSPILTSALRLGRGSARVHTCTKSTPPRHGRPSTPDFFFVERC